VYRIALSIDPFRTENAHMNLPDTEKERRETSDVSRLQRAVQNLSPDSISYQIREQHREPDDRIAALQAEETCLSLQLSDFSKRKGLNTDKIYSRLKEIKDSILELEGSPDRVCRLRRLYGKESFARWLSTNNKAKPTILRFGVPVPPSEQDGYYQRDYQEWCSLGLPVEAPALGPQQTMGTDQEAQYPIRAPGSAFLPLAILADLTAQVREAKRISREELSRRTGIGLSAIELFEEQDPGSLTLKQLAILLNGLDCWLQARPAANGEKSNAEACP
jgi:hypothetical protein